MIVISDAIEDLGVRKPMNVEYDPAYEPIIYDLLEAQIKTDGDMVKFLREKMRKLRLKKAPSVPELLYTYNTMVLEKKIVRNKYYEQFMIAKKVRSESGVIVVTVVTSPWPKTVEASYGNPMATKPHESDAFEKSTDTMELSKQNKHFSCKYDCWFCPSEPGMPRSYIMKEPSVARANQYRYDSVKQFRGRGETYKINGHPFDKIELLVLGGTWSSYPLDYQEEFIRDLYYAANTFYDNNFNSNPRQRLAIEKEIKLNESSNCRIIGLTLETRPDQINYAELKRFRRFGVTRVQIGVQHTDNDVLKYVNRGCTIEDVIKAIKLLKDNCFKVDIHLMPDLPGSNPEKDAKMFNEILTNPYLQADQQKIYPCSVLPWTQIEKWYENEKDDYDVINNPDHWSPKDNRRYKPYAEEALENMIEHGKIKIPSSPLIELLIDYKSKIHPWIRINRLIRDIPSKYVSTEGYREDLRQVLQKEMHKRGLECKCMRCREVKGKKTDVDKAELIVREYDASDGKEFFISYESPDRKILYGFLRLRIVHVSMVKESNVFPELKNCALVRELHVYGNVNPVHQNIDKTQTQHLGFGKKLLKKAEWIALSYSYDRIAVISGVGVRNYYRKLGYLDYPGDGNFQIKTLDWMDM